MRKLLLLLFFAINASIVNAQDFNYKVELVPQNIPNLFGVQAFAHAEYLNNYLIIGGRLDGLHRRQPNASFDIAGHNNQILIINPIENTSFAKSLSTLPISIREQLSSTNMQYHQEGNILYLIGGYGYSTDSADHITFPYLTAIKIDELVNAIKNNTSINNCFRQIHDEQFAVTGAHLKKIYNTYYLVGGQRFDGRYNPMMHATFVQNYTNAYLKFNIVDNGSTIQIINKQSVVDSSELHRRDYNVIPQITKNREEGVIAFSGVFQTQADIPYLNSVSIDSSGYYANPNFSQYYNHYHCATIPLYDSAKNEMHNLFFGGIAQYYDSAGILIQDNNAPFVKTIARVSRDANGNLAEYKLLNEMPGYLGAGAEFLINQNISTYKNDVIKLNKLNGDTMLLGYIFGGINSPSKNIFWINDGTQSTASNVFYKVLLTKSSGTSGILNKQSTNKLQLQIYPNPNEGKFHLVFNLESKQNIDITIYNENGKVVCERIITDAEIGENRYRIEENKLKQPGLYLIKLKIGNNEIVQKIIVE